MAYTKQITVLNDDQVIEQITAIIQGNAELAGNGSYLEILRRMQLGEWAEAVPMLKLLKAQYPEARELDLLLSEVTLRAEYDATWDGKIKGRRAVINIPKLSAKVLPVTLVALLIVGSIFYYGQRSKVRALNDTRASLMEQAQTAMMSGKFQDAHGLYGQLLAEDSKYPGALSGQQEAERMMEIDGEYEQILGKIDSGELRDALASLIDLQERSPGFRDVPLLIKQLQGQETIAEVFSNAESAFAAQNWRDAIAHYESARQIDSTYERDKVTENLITAYIQAGQAIVAKSPTDGADLEQAQTDFEKALKLRLGEPTAKLEAEMLDTYLYGQQFLDDGKLLRGIDVLLPIYQSRSDYLNGYLVQSLYEAYLQLGDDAQAAGELRIAMGYFGKAAALKVTTREVALARLREVSLALTPTPTPTIPPTPYPTATPIPPTLADYKGWILFRTNRDGGTAFYVMRPDGSDAQPAPPEAMDLYKELFEEQQWSPDGKARLYVLKEEKTSGATFNIYKERVDLPENWNRVSRMSDLDGTSYDPVWSPDNKNVAFVSNVTGGDEIWIMHPDGRDHTQLTFNDWPWDKHPTWSPDGQTIMFWSNRTGMRQIWTMKIDGSDQEQLTTEYENWDPIWLK